MRLVQDVAFDVDGQSVYFDVPEGRPSSVTSADVWPWDAGDDGDAESAIDAPAVETNPATTIDAASGYGQADPRVLNVAATTGFVVGRSYLVTAADGARERFEVAEIDSGNSVTAKHPLHNAYASADTVQSTRITAALDSAWIADSGNLILTNPGYRVRWVYVVNSVTYVADTYFNLVRYPARHGVTALDIDELVPGWLDSLPTDYRADQGRKLIDAAHREVKIDMYQIDIPATGLAESEIVDELVRHKVVELGEWAKLLAGGGDTLRSDMAKQKYTARLDSVVRLAARTPTRTVSGAASPRISTPLSRR